MTVGIAVGLEGLPVGALVGWAGAVVGALVAVGEAVGVGVAGLAVGVGDGAISDAKKRTFLSNQLPTAVIMVFWFLSKYPPVSD